MAELAEAPFAARDGQANGSGTAFENTGMESPRQLADAMPMVERAFVFVDLCGFTEFMATNGEHSAVDALERVPQPDRVRSQRAAASGSPSGWATAPC